MHEYDAAFKLILQHSVDVTIREVAGSPIAQWLNVELPDVRSPRVDLLGRTASGELIHIELQSTNDSRMPMRMAEYGLHVLRHYGSFPEQVLLYVGEAPLRMEQELHAGRMHYSYRVVDVRELDGQRLLDSPRVGDNIVAVLTGLPELRSTIRQVILRIAGLEVAARESALRQLLVLAGLRSAGQMVVEEARKMPILNDIMDHEVLGREYKRGQEEGREMGREEGRKAGWEEGERDFFRRLAEKRFGDLPFWVEARLAELSKPEIEALGLRLLDARTLDELFR